MQRLQHMVVLLGTAALFTGCSWLEPKPKLHEYSAEFITAWGKSCEHRQDDLGVCMCALDAARAIYTESKFMAILGSANSSTLDPDIAKWLVKTQDSCAIDAIER